MPRPYNRGCPGCVKAGNVVVVALISVMATPLFAAPANQVSIGVGAAGYVGSVPSGATDGGLRGSLLVDAAVEHRLFDELSVGFWGSGGLGGGDLYLSPSDRASESIHTFTSALLLERNWDLDALGTISGGLGGGIFYVSDQVGHGDGTLSSAGWAPLATAQAVWQAPLGRTALYRIRLGWSWAQTNLALDGNPGVRLKSDWSRLELTLGLGFGL